ncbi:MAG: hypothetical protein E7589_02765 [Ruminococcaceae bacterium]|nr:hypothetical protein [Oscillospiraceae bacterium]
MGKGKRARVERAGQKENNPELFLAKANTKKKKSFPTVTVVFCAVLVFVVAIMAWTLVKNSGIIGRGTVVVESENLSVNDNELSVYEFMAANEWSNQFYTEYMYYQYGMMQDTYGVTKAYSSAQEYASAMINVYRTNGLLENQAYEYAKEFLAFSEGALDNGYTLDNEEVKKSVDEYMNSLSEQADSSHTSFGNYISSSIGAGVSKNDIRSAMTKYFLSSTYQEELSEEFSDKVTSEELDKYLDGHKEDFFTSVYDSYVLMDKEMKEYFDKLQGDDVPENADDLKELVCDYLFNKKFDELYKTKFTDAKVEDADAEKTKADILETIKAENKLEGEYEAVFTSKGEGDYNKAAYEIVKSISTDVAAQLKSVAADKSVSYSDPTASKATDLEKFLFDTKTVKGTVKIIEATSGTGDKAKTTYTYYIAKDIMVLDTECTKNAGYLLLKDDANTVENKKTAAQKADAFMNALGKAPTSDKFEEVAKDYTTGNVMYEKISQDGVTEELGEWLYDEARKANEVAKITVSGGVYVVIYVDENEMTWKANARDAITAEKLDDWYETALEGFKVVAHTEAATTTESKTEAATTEAATTAA